MCVCVYLGGGGGTWVCGGSGGGKGWEMRHARLLWASISPTLDCVKTSSPCLPHARLQVGHDLLDKHGALVRRLQPPPGWDRGNKDTELVAWLANETVQEQASVLVFCGTKRVRCAQNAVTFLPSSLMLSSSALRFIMLTNPGLLCASAVVA